MDRKLLNKTSAIEMLQSLKNDHELIRKKINDCEFEMQEKLKKFTENELILTEPVPPAEILAKMEGKLNQLRANTVDLESRLVNERDRPKEDKLAIFRQQVVLVIKKKEELLEEIKSLGEERTQNEILINQNKKELVF